MPKFQYTAVNTEGKTLHGVVEADELKSAKYELNSIGLKVVDLQEIDLKTKLLKSNLNKYKFEAINSEGKVVKGTIAALDQNKAYQRLIDEYSLDVQKISHINASNKAFENSEPKKAESNLTKTVEDPTRIKALRANLIPLIDDVKAMMKLVKNDLSDNVGGNVIEFIDKYLLHLDKIKFSENVYNVQSICLKICNVFEASDVFYENGEKTEDKLRVNLMARDLEKKIKYFDVPPSKAHRLLPQDDSSFFSLVSILFQSKSNSQRKLVVMKILGNLKDSLALDKIKQALPMDYVSEIFFWLFCLYTAILLSFHFVSEKVFNFNLPEILYIYQTNVLIYVCVFFLLGHFSLELSKFMRKNLLKLAINSIFMVMFLLICINL